MKYFLLILVLLSLTGCYTPSGIQKQIEILQEGNPSFSASFPTAAGRVNIFRVAPTIGFSATANALGVSQTTPTNIPISLSFHSVIPGPTMPATQTNQVSKAPVKK